MSSQPKQETELNKWIEYERRKAQIPADLPPEEYMRECARIAEGLGI